ncbi:3',5'-cyclic-nucleotide phosphodiesterase [Angomonas deanei]|nr:3',5'-cyclic-nucleotide phosphodiesterase [Angomonas deanei]|eukprot:EPY33643.1 3',5'-cyclic-nucleotide phosphodiesterase [Angomonas deanei]
MSSVLPQIPKNKTNKASISQGNPTSQTSVQHSIDCIQSLTHDNSLPSEARNKLKEVLASLNNLSEGSPTTTPRKATGKIAAFLNDSVNGNTPLFHSLPQAAMQNRAYNLNIAGSVTPSTSKTLDRRPFPAIQNPEETFKKMNEIMMQTLKYVDSVAELEFDVADIHEVDGSLMEDPDRIFMCVVSSVFAGFSFCTSMGLDLKKLLHLLEELTGYYPKENPYHNALHAADSVQMLSLFFRDPSVNYLFTDEDMLFGFLCTLALDVCHPGMSSDSLALLNHSLFSVFGDLAPTQHASLMVFLHELSRDENFIFSDSSALPTFTAIPLIRAVISDVVVLSAPRIRTLLLDHLKDISRKRSVKNDDIPTILSALLILADAAFTLRPRKQCLGLGAKYLTELRREANELNRRGIPSSVVDVLDCSVNEFVAGYSSSIVKPVADSVKFLISFDLLDNLSRNGDASIKDETDPPALNEAASRCWVDNSNIVMDVLKKTANHASSLDRKASKRAILNASPPRAGITTPPMLSPSSRNGSMFNLGSSIVDLEGSHASIRLPNRAEHYFSFLRLYDECEHSGATSADFKGRLMFLALQLDPTYISGKAREKFGTECSGQECVQMAEFILENEDVPSTAEGIAGRVPGTNNASAPPEDESCTDGFLLFLMNMFSTRESAHLQTIEGDRESSGSTRPPSVASEDSSPSPPPQRDSPIRLPINTDSSATFPSA